MTAPCQQERFATIMTETEPDVAAVALQLLNEHRVVPKALPFMVRRTEEDPAFRDAVLARLIEGQCRREMEAQLAHRHQEHKRQTGGGPVGSARSSDLTDWAGAVASSLMEDFKLPDGTKLGDATRLDLQKAMNLYSIQVRDGEVKLRWLQLIQQCVPANKTVRAVLTDARIAELRDEARKGDA